MTILVSVENKCMRTIICIQSQWELEDNPTRTSVITNSITKLMNASGSWKFTQFKNDQT